MIRLGASFSLIMAVVLSIGCSSSGSPGTGGSGGTAGASGTAGSGGASGRGGTAESIIDAMVASVDAARYEADLTSVAQVRNLDSQAWQDTQDFCAERLDELGFVVERQAYATGVNVIGTLAGANDEQIIVSAHYDAVPDCIGADDNASGIAGILEVARALTMAEYERTLVVACWDEEEVGLLGSFAYANRAIDNGTDIPGMYSFDMIGYKSDEPNTQLLPPGIDILFPEEAAELEANEFRGDFIALIADESSRALNDAFEQYADSVELPWVELEVPDGILTNPIAGDLQRSDHAAFWLVGYPGIQVTDSANFRNPNYHCAGGPDTIESLDTDFAVKVIKSVVGATATELGVR